MTRPHLQPRIRSKVERPRIFISYSRRDERLVLPVIEIMRVSGKPDIFRDNDRLKPGDLWRPTVVNALSRCRAFMLFWCWHSKASRPVTAEWKQALRQSKRVIPILLDSTRLPKRLAECQWIDLRLWMDAHESKSGRIWDVRHLIEPTTGAAWQLRDELWALLNQEEQ